MELNHMIVIEEKLILKAFAIPILTEGRCSQNRDSKRFRINLSSMYNNHMIEFHLVSIVV